MAAALRTSSSARWQKALSDGSSSSLVAVESGYVDQSHLNRDVMAFTGVTPMTVAAAPWLAVDDVAWP